MMVAVEGWLRVFSGRLRSFAGRARVRRFGKWMMLAGAGFFLSGASLGGSPQPAALALMLALGTREGILPALGSMAGFPLFWGEAGKIGIWWAMGGAFLGALELKDVRLRATLGAAMVSALGLWARGTGGPALPFSGYCTGIFLTWGLARLGPAPGRLGRWLWCGVLTLALMAVSPWELPVGYLAAGALAVGASFPAAVLAGLGAELTGLTPVPLAGLLGLGWLARFLPRCDKLRFLMPAALTALSMVVMNNFQWRLPLLLALGGALGLLIPRSCWVRSPDSRVGRAQVGLEEGAGILTQLQRSLAAADPPPIDREAVLRRVKTRTCALCSHRANCLEQSRLTEQLLEGNEELPCRNRKRLRWELSRGREQLRLLTAERRRREEYRGALLQQLGFLSGYLRRLSDGMTLAREQVRIRFTLSIGVRSRGKERSCGDVWAAFPGWGGRFFLLLCDGMGTGLGARQEAAEAAGLLKALLKARIPPDRALGTLNSLLTLSGRAGAVTVDLAAIRLDTGVARLYKWGAVPSFLLSPGQALPLGTPSAPPGITLMREFQQTMKADLTRGQTLVMLTDGAQPEAVLTKTAAFLGRPPGELAEKLLEGKLSDDATAAVVRLRRKGRETPMQNEKRGM